MTDDTSITEDVEFVFQRRSSAPIAAVLWFLGGFAALGFAALGMLLAMIGNVNQLSLQAMTTVPTLVGLAALAAGWSTARAPSEVTVGPDGLMLNGRRGPETFSWERIGWATIGAAPLNQKRNLKIFDVDGKTIASISEAFDDFNGLVELVQQRIADRTDDTADRLQLQKSRRAALFTGGAGVLFLGLAGVNVWMAHEEQRTAQLLVEQGVAGQAEVVRRFMAPNGVTRRLEYRVTSPTETDDVCNTEITREFWDSLEEVETVAVIVVAEEPSISRLVEGEVIRDDPTTSPNVMYFVSAGVALLSLLGIVAGVMQWQGWDIDLDSETKRLSIKRFGTGK